MKYILTVLIGIFSIVNVYSQNRDYKRLEDVVWIYKLDQAAFNENFELKKDIRPYISYVDTTRDLNKSIKSLPYGTYIYSSLNIYSGKEKQSYKVEYITPYKIEFLHWNDKILILPIDQKGRIIKEASVFTVKEKIPFNDELNAFVINKKQKLKLKVSHNGYQQFFSLGEKNKNFSYRSENSPQSFWITNQPEYKPGDTLKLKYFDKRLAKKSTPIRIQLRSSITYGKDTILTINPYRKGFYEFEFPLNSFPFTLDKPISILALNKKAILWESIKYSQYELKDIKLDFTYPTSSLAKEDTLDIPIKVIDGNGLTLYDASVLVEIEFINPLSTKIDTNYLGFDKIVYNQEIPLNDEGIAHLKLPVSDLPNIASSYKTKVIATTSNFQEKEKTFEFKVSHALSFELETLSENELIIHSKNNHQIKNQFKYTVLNKNNDTVLVKTLVVGQVIQYDKFWNKIIIDDSNNKTYTLDVAKIQIPRVEFVEKLNTVDIRVEAQERFWYNVYKNKALLKQGYDTLYKDELAYKFTDIIYVDIYYLDEGQIKSFTRRFYESKNNIQIEKQLNGKAYPGDKIENRVVIKDKAGNPLIGLDVTAYGYKSHFTNKRLPFEQASKIVEMDNARKDIYSKSFPLISKKYLLSNQNSDVVLAAIGKKNVVIEEEIEREEPSYLLFYNGKSKLKSIYFAEIPIYSFLQNNTALIDYPSLKENDSLLVIMNDFSFYLTPGSLKPNTKKVIILNESVLFQDTLLVKKTEKVTQYLESNTYINLEQVASYKNKMATTLRTATGFIELDNVYTVGNIFQYRTLDFYKIKNYRLENEPDLMFKIKNWDLYASPIKNSWSYNTLQPQVIKIQSLKYLDSLHFHKQITYNAQYGNENTYVSNLLYKPIIRVVAKTDSSLDVYPPDYLQLKTNKYQHLYFYISYNEIYRIDSILGKEVNIIRLDSTAKLLDSTARERLLFALEARSGFLNLLIESRMPYKLEDKYYLKVVDEYGDAIKDVSIKYGNNKGTLTNNDGEAFIPLEFPSVVISKIGYENSKIDLRTSNWVILQPINSTLEEVVVVGYGLAGSSNNEIANTLSGRVAGVTTESPTSMNIRIRGNSAIYGSRNVSAVDLLKFTPSVIISDEEVKFESSYSPKIRNSFKDDSHWFSKLTTDENGVINYSYKLPDDITSWDNHLIVTDGKSIFEHIQWVQKAYLPLFTELEMPKFLLRGDQFQLTTKLRNSDDSTSIDISSSLHVDNKLIDSQQTNLKNIYTKTYSLNAVGEDSIKFRFLVTHDNRLLDGIQKEVPLLNVGTEVANHDYFVFHKDTAFTIYKNNLPKWITVSNKYSISILEKIQSLKEYPYDCNEQLASRIIGFITDKNLKQLDSIRFKDFYKVERLIQKLLRNQNKEGGWSWFGKEISSGWVTAHVYKTLLFAKENGFKVDDDQLKLAEKLIYTWAQSNDSNRKYGMDIFPIKEIYKGSRLELERESLKDEQLQIIWAKAKKELDSSIIKKLKIEDEIAYLPTRDFYRYDVLMNNIQLNISLYEYLSSIDHPLSNKVLNMLMGVLQSKEHLNTYNASQLLRVLQKEIIELAPKEEIYLSLNGKEVQFNSDEIYNEPMLEDSIRVVYKGNNRIELSSYYKYWDTTTTEKFEGYKIESNWKTTMKAGETQKLTVKVEVSKSRDYVMVEIPIPAGLDYVEKPNSGGKEYYRSYYNHQVVVFYENVRPGTYYIEVPLKARYTGKYYINPAKISEQYFPVFYGKTGIKIMEVREGKE